MPESLNSFAKMIASSEGAMVAVDTNQEPGEIGLSPVSPESERQASQY